MRQVISASLAALIVVAEASAALAQYPIVYPARGQSFEQQSMDEGQCRQWAQQQTGYTPSNAPPAYYGDQRESLVRGGARGAAVGAVGGAIMGDAGKGAAAGAAMGATGTVLRNSRNRRQEAQYNQQAQAQVNQANAQYNSAFAACMTGRGYTVQ